LPSQNLTGASQDLRECLAGGTAFHNTNLLRAEREVIEKGYRDPNGGIHVLAATTTLAAGINTPASTVVLAENEFVGEDGRQFTVAEYKNMARGVRADWATTRSARPSSSREDGVRRMGSGLAIRLRNPLKPRFLRPFLTIRVEV
jgi:superfamily II RNA helicase